MNSKHIIVNNIEPSSLNYLTIFSNFYEIVQITIFMFLPSHNGTL